VCCFESAASFRCPFRIVNAHRNPVVAVVVETARWFGQPDEEVQRLIQRIGLMPRGHNRIASIRAQVRSYLVSVVVHFRLSTVLPPS
jgi:hypothetical protein